jgi:NodT family efflux transporter outer membrane factor (OMF) lipoprotein
MLRRASLRLAVASSMAAALAACAVGPDYVAPKTQLNPLHNWGAVKSRTAVAPAPALDQWWLGFNDPELVTIVQRALDQNLDLAAAMARVQQARAAARGSRAQLLPSVDLNATGLAERQSIENQLGQVEGQIPGFTRYERDFTMGGTASWELDVFGGLRRESRAAQDELEAAYADHAGTRVTVVADAADAYLQIRGFQARIAVAQEQIDTDQRLLSLVEVRRRLGDADAREAAQADALLKQARASLPDLQINLQAELNRLDVLMGTQPGTYAKELEEREEIPGIPAISVDDPAVEMLRRRPDVIAAERRLAESNERIGAAIADYYPKVSLSGVLGFDSDNIHHLFTNRAFQPIGSGAISWRLFDFGKVSSEVAQARGAKAEALATYQQSVLKAAEDVENALITLSQTEVHVVEIQGEVDSLARARDLSEKSYKAGAITLTDVLDANRQLLTARDDLYTNRANAARAAVQIFRAFGGGWGSLSGASIARNQTHSSP